MMSEIGLNERIEREAVASEIDIALLKSSIIKSIVDTIQYAES